MYKPNQHWVIPRAYCILRIHTQWHQARQIKSIRECMVLGNTNVTATSRHWLSCLVLRERWNPTKVSCILHYDVTFRTEKCETWQFILGNFREIVTLGHFLLLEGPLLPKTTDHQFEIHFNHDFHVRGYIARMHMNQHRCVLWHIVI